jgi:hypothetical protein
VVLCSKLSVWYVRAIVATSCTTLRTVQFSKSMQQLTHAATTKTRQVAHFVENIHLMATPDNDDQYTQSGIFEQLTQLTRVHLTCSSCVPKATCDIDICVRVLPASACNMLIRFCCAYTE